MQNEPTALRVEDPGVRGPLHPGIPLPVVAGRGGGRWPRPQAPAGDSPPRARRKRLPARLSFPTWICQPSTKGLARTGHPLVPVIWELFPGMRRRRRRVCPLGGHNPEHHPNGPAAGPSPGPPDIPQSDGFSPECPGESGRRDQGIPYCRKDSRPARRFPPPLASRWPCG